MRRLRALLVDDESLARERLRGMLVVEPAVEVIGECANAHEALAAIQCSAPDVVFLDIQMPGTDGLQVAAGLPEEGRPAIVFTTAHEKFALGAFNLAAVDYLLKPFDQERLGQAVRRVQDCLRAKVGGAGAPEVVPAAQCERLAFRADGRIVLFRPEEIRWIEADDNYVVLHLGSGRLMVRETLGAIEARLPPSMFTRVNRSALVQTDQIKELTPALYGDYTVVLRDGTKLPLSRSLRGQLGQLATGGSQ